MDIDYLLVLQQARETLPKIVEQLFAALSYVGEGPVLVAIMLIVYWCLDKRIGQFAMACMSAGNFVSQLIKNLVCVYRPWIRDARIVPSELAIDGAGGYSFPSGHVTGTTTALGSFAWLLRRRNKAIVVVCVIIILLMAFSRNFLGVHTPQDVLVGLIIAVVMIALTNAFFNWMDRYDAMVPGHNKDVIVLVVTLVVCAASIVVVTLKPYPLDYVDGALLVNPESMMKGSFEAAGLLAGFAVGWFLERRFVGFTTDSTVTVKERIVRGVIGVAIVGVTYVATDVIFKAIMTYNWAKMCAFFTLVVVALFVVPLTFNFISTRFGTHPTRESVKAQLENR